MNELAASLHELWVAWTTYMVNSYGDRLPPELITSWRQAWKPYSELSTAQKQVRKSWAKRVQGSMPKTKVVKETDPRAKALASEFQSMCHQIKGFKPEVSWAIETQMIKNKLTTYSPEELKREFDWFLSDDISKKLGCTIKLALSNYVFNKWLQDDYGN